MRRCGLVLSALLLVGCARLGIDTSSGSISASASAGPTAGVVSPEPTNAPSPPDVPTDCGELPIDACRLVVDAAVRLVAPGAELTGVAVTPWHGEQGCGEGKPLPCPSMPPHYVNGAELQLADRRPLALDCYSPATQYLFDPVSPESEKAWSSVVVCEAVDEAERPSASMGVAAVGRNQGDTGLWLYEAGGGVSFAATPVCYSGGVIFPFSYYFAEAGPDGNPVSKVREIFRSEDVADRARGVYLVITIRTLEDVTVEEVDKSGYQAACRAQQGGD